MTDAVTPASPTLIGDRLVEAGFLNKAQVNEAVELQSQWGVRFGDVVLGKGWLRPYDFYQVLCAGVNCEFVDLLKEPPDPHLAVLEDLPHYMQLLIMPWRMKDGHVVLACADPTDDARAFAHKRFGPDATIVVTAKFDIIWTLQTLFETHLTSQSVRGLLNKRPDLSAFSVFTGRQLGFFYVILVAALVCFLITPGQTLLVANVVLSLFYMVSMMLRGLLIWLGSSHKIDTKVTDAEVAQLTDAHLPVYTVLVPMYKEAEVVARLASGIRNLDYPISKLDVKLVLEEDDLETIAAAKALGLESIFEILRVPPSQPKTKPKACNYALAFARGDYVTVFDAEDRPEPDQLKKAIVGFRKASRDTACLQARLNYFNRDENWLTRMFTLDYSLWFDFMLPGLERLGIPIPLGGTSNHFRAHVLRELNGWDPFNVTEDADLGVRMTQLGYKCGVINSTTFEEANNHLGNWIRQRSRWIKGYMQTYLVHMRSPIKLYRSVGFAGFWGFQFFIGGSVFVVLVNPLLWGFFFLWLFAGPDIRWLFPGLILDISAITFLVGNAMFIYFNMVGAFKRKYYHLIPYALTAIPYWWLMSLASYKGLWQLIHKPFFWEKTRHGLSRHPDATTPFSPAPAGARAP